VCTYSLQINDTKFNEENRMNIEKTKERKPMREKNR